MLPPFIVYRGCYRIVVLPPVGRCWTNPWAVTTRNAGTIHLFCCILSLSLSRQIGLFVPSIVLHYLLWYLFSTIIGHIFFMVKRMSFLPSATVLLRKKKILITLLGLALFTVAYLTEVRAQRPNYARWMTGLVAKKTPLFRKQNSATNELGA